VTVTNDVVDASPPLVLDEPVGAPPSTPAAAPRSRWIDDWRPEDPTFWATTGERVARRNLVWSILSEHVGFCIWSMWSAIVLFLGPRYGFDPGQKFLLTTAPTAVGAALRIPYTFAVGRFGGRNWTIVSSALLLVPAVLTAIVLKPGVSFGTLLAVALVAGVGGGNFSSSMANIDAFFPQRSKGWALGLNAGGGNLGVAAVQLVGLAVLAIAGVEHPRLILAVYIPLIVVATAGAALRMDNLTAATNDRGAMREVMREPHAWVISLLYVGTFGSFIGFGFAFGQVLLVQFGGRFDTPVKAASLTFLGPLVGSLARPVGGWLADRFGGSRVTLVAFVAMAGAAGVVLAASLTSSLSAFIVGFILIFALTGLGNGSTYKMIPAIFATQADRAIAAGTDPALAARDARRRSRALIGIAGAVGAFGGVFVNLALRQAFITRGTGTAAYIAFGAFYLLCVIVVWACYRRPGAPTRGRV
jgi:NNP family nitrate/nitrite transporter-like MFS transporter